MNGTGIQNKKQKLFCCLLFLRKGFIHNCPYGTLFKDSWHMRFYFLRTGLFTWGRVEEDLNAIIQIIERLIYRDRYRYLALILWRTLTHTEWECQSRPNKSFRKREYRYTSEISQVSDHHNKENVTIKQVRGFLFCFPLYISYVYTYCNLLIVQYCHVCKYTYTLFTNILLLKKVTVIWALSELSFCW